MKIKSFPPQSAGRRDRLSNPRQNRLLNAYKATHEKAPDAACWPCARRFLIGCPLGWPGSACFASGVSCTRPPAHKANRPARRASGYTAYSCSCHSTARCAPLPADHRRGPLQRQTGAEAPCRGMWAALYLFPPSVVRGLSISPALGRRSV